MTTYVAGRVGQALLVLLAAFTLSFLLLQALPGDGILIKFMSPELGLSPEQIADIRASYGADAPIWSQFLHTLGNFLTGHFGYSLQAGVPVADALAVNLPTTLRLASLGFLAALTIAMVLALAASMTGLGWLRSALEALPSIFVSVPVFWLGILLIQTFSFQLKLVPVINPGPWEGMILPVLTLAVPISAPLAQIMMRQIDEVSTQPFVAVARAKGASRGWVLLRHIVPNAIPPVLTISGVLFGELLTGAVVTEAVFGLGGLGTLTQQAVGNQDIAILQAIVVLSAAAFVVINLVIDLIFPLLDPRFANGRSAST